MKMRAGRKMLLLMLTALFPLAAWAQDQEAPGPEDRKPAGELIPPASTAGAEAQPAVPGPMVQFGEFELDLTGRIQILAGLVGQDAHVMNGDSLSRDGFRIRRARLGLEGQLIKPWEYALELDLLDEDSGGNTLLDANVTFRPAECVWVKAGAGKPLFSRTLMVSSGSMQFVERPPWVNIERSPMARTNMLDLDRQVGVTVGGKVQLFSYAVGAYNGSPGFSVGDLNQGLLYLVRLGLEPDSLGETEADHERSGLRWAVALNGYYNAAPAADIRGVGVDLGLKFRGLSFYAEALWAKSVPAARPGSTNTTLDEVERYGMYAQAGYLLPFAFADLEVAVRFSIMDENVHVLDEGDLWELAVGLNAYLYGEKVKLMLNYFIKEELEGVDLSNDALISMLQLMF